MFAIPPLVARQINLDHHQIFDQLKSLVGKWEGINEEQNPVSIAYNLSANDTVLVEDWTFDNGVEALTLYSMDETILTAMHYCPIGNQPRLILKERLGTGVLLFEFHSAMNLPDENAEHEHAFDLLLVDSNTFIRNETYRTDGRAEKNGTTYFRTQ